MAPLVGGVGGAALAPSWRGRYAAPEVEMALLFALIVGCTTEDTGRHPIPKDERPPLDTDTDTDADTDADTDSDTDSDTDADTDADTDSDTDTDTDTDPGPDPAEACHPDVRGWPAASARWEEQVVDLVNDARAAGADCGSYGVFPAIGPLTMDPDLQCAARYHSLWMSENDSFTHESPGGDMGEDPWQRIAASGFGGSGTGENIAAGYASPADAVAGWLDSDGHCANIMSSARLTGVGYFQGGSWGHWWTQDFGS